MLSFFRTLIAIDLSTLFLIFNYREWLGRVLQVDSTKKNQLKKIRGPRWTEIEYSNILPNIGKYLDEFL